MCTTIGPIDYYNSYGIAFYDKERILNYEQKQIDIMIHIKRTGGNNTRTRGGVEAYIRNLINQGLLLNPQIRQDNLHPPIINIRYDRKKGL